MKILCICKQGIVRSGALAWLLKTEFGHNAINVGWEFNDRDIIWDLMEWADKVIALDQTAMGKIGGHETHNVLLFDVGDDRWHDPAHPELHSILRKMIQEKLK